MKIDFRKIDFRQGKYWFPLVLFVPIVAIAYFSCQMFTGKATDTGVVTDSINTTMPEPEGYGLHNKYAEMEDNLVRGDGYTAINELGEGESQDEEDNVYWRPFSSNCVSQGSTSMLMMTTTQEAIPVEDSNVTWSALKSRCARSRNEAGRWHGTLQAMTIHQEMVIRHKPIRMPR